MNIESQGHIVVLSQDERFRRIIAIPFAVVGTVLAAGAAYGFHELLNRPQTLSVGDLLGGLFLLAAGLFGVSSLWFLPRTTAVIDTRRGEICISHVAPLRQRHTCYALTDIVKVELEESEGSCCIYLQLQSGAKIILSKVGMGRAEADAVTNTLRRLLLEAATGLSSSQQRSDPRSPAVSSRSAQPPDTWFSRMMYQLGRMFR